MQNQRIGALAQVADHWYLVWPLAFILSALLAMVGYFLVRRFGAGSRRLRDSGN
ncbi:H(+)/Cl(-) exchange transporter ClcA [Klebsiella pneumoniae]|uniref:H(+)/Cl(-) exchange transporter ClcA n=1 Tax=Klebsiella pneumoniae TaxID=573 RepID=A0A3S4KI83_KLEPN|nr:H(+)/Cl(-) exchange transporter ClcA [Klebsiella pneumoniae]